MTNKNLPEKKINKPMQRSINLGREEKHVWLYVKNMLALHVWYQMNYSQAHSPHFEASFPF